MRNFTGNIAFHRYISWLIDPYLYDIFIPSVFPPISLFCNQYRRIAEVAGNIAESAGAKAEVNIRKMYPVTYNDPTLTELMLPTLRKTTGPENLLEHELFTGAEDFSFYQKAKPGLCIFLGGMPADGDPLKAPSHHTPDFYLDESGFVLGVKALNHLAVDYLEMGGK